MRFQLNDIVIKSPGVQLREKIIDKYGSIRNFADEIGLYETSITQYLSSKKLGSSTFKIRTMNAFHQDFNDLYKTDEEQIRYFTDLVSWYIHEYVFIEDVEILERLKMLSLEKKLYEDYAIICRAYAHYYFNQERRSRAKAYIEVALNSVQDRDNLDRIGLYIGDRIMIEGPEMTKMEFRKAVEEFYEALKHVSGPLTTGHMHMKLGMTYFELEQYEESRKMFKVVLNYHKDSESRSFTYMWLGDVEKKLANMDKALEYYREAEKLLNYDDKMVYYVYDEYALYYLKKGDLSKAEHFIDKIFDDKKWRISSHKHMKLKTFIEIKLLNNKENEIADMVNRLLDEIEEGYIYTRHHLAVIGEELGRASLSSQIIKRLVFDIAKFYKKSNLPNEESALVKQLIGSITLNDHYEY